LVAVSKYFAFYGTAVLDKALVTVILELLTTLLEYLDFFNEIKQSVNFLAVKALLSPQNASCYLHIPIMPEIILA